MDRAAAYLISNYNPKGARIGWLMMASILVEAWDLYSIAFVLIFIRDAFHPSPAMLGLAGAATQGGAVIGALFGGWLWLFGRELKQRPLLPVHDAQIPEVVQT